jgi:hypothetical protein
MRASDANIIPANYLRQENILTIVSSFFQDIHKRWRTSSQGPSVAALSIDRFCRALRDPELRIIVLSQVDIFANRAGGLMPKHFLDRMKNFS